MAASLANAKSINSRSGRYGDKIRRNTEYSSDSSSYQSPSEYPVVVADAVVYDVHQPTHHYDVAPTAAAAEYTASTAYETAEPVTTYAAPAYDSHYTTTYVCYHRDRRCLIVILILFCSFEQTHRMPYSFSYAVKDDYYYNDQAHEQTSDGNGYVSGSYRVLLPDGRTQIVTYVADNYGYRADVKYEGVAKPYEYTKPAYKTPVVAYQQQAAVVDTYEAVEYQNQPEAPHYY